MTGVTKSYLTYVPDDILGLKPLPIYIKEVVARMTLSILKKSDLITGDLNGHHKILLLDV